MFSALTYVLVINYDLELRNDCQFWNPEGVYKLLGITCSESNFNQLYWISTLTAPLASIGFLYRFTGIISAFSGMLFLGYNYNLHRFYHSYHLFVVSLIILSIACAADSFSIDSLIRKVKNKKKFNYSWPVQLIKVYVVYVYFICGAEKLYIRGLDWVFSDNLFLIIFTNPQRGWFSDWVLSQPLWMSVALAGYSLFVCELLAPLALLNRRTGLLFWFIWLSFHVGVQLTLGGHKMFFTQLVTASVFLLPQKLNLKSFKNIVSGT